MRLLILTARGPKEEEKKKRFFGRKKPALERVRGGTMECSHGSGAKLDRRASLGRERVLREREKKSFSDRYTCLTADFLPRVSLETRRRTEGASGEKKREKKHVFKRIHAGFAARPGIFPSTDVLIDLRLTSPPWRPHIPKMKKTLGKCPPSVAI